MADWKAKIYFVDDDLFLEDKDLVSYFESHFKRNEYLLVCEGNIEGAYEYIRDNPAYDVLIADLSLGRYSGLDLINLSKRTRPSAKNMLVSGYNSPNSLVDKFLQKPFTSKELLREVQLLLGHSFLSSSEE